MTDALWALLGVVVGTVGTGVANYFNLTKQLGHNKEMYLLQNKAAETVKAVLTEMLNHRSYVDRSFESLKAPIGGYSDDEIRLFLHEVGAKRVVREGHSEWWYLLAREEERQVKRTPHEDTSTA